MKNLEKLILFCGICLMLGGCGMGKPQITGSNPEDFTTEKSAMPVDVNETLVENTQQTAQIVDTTASEEADADDVNPALTVSPETPETAANEVALKVNEESSTQTKMPTQDDFPTQEMGKKTTQAIEGNPIENLAKCMSEKGVRMYGATWCPHCQEQKKMFGDYFRHIEYIECDSNTPDNQVEKCRSDNIQGYPTWVFPKDAFTPGRRSLEELAKYSGCEYNPQ